MRLEIKLKESLKKYFYMFLAGKSARKKQTKGGSDRINSYLYINI
jgi:hypothetical protein